MPAPTLYRSTDVNAPPLSGVVGSLVNLLDACLVNGYGSTFATGTITNDGTQPTDGDSVTVGSITYTFRNALAAINDVKIGASAAATVVSLAKAINGTGVAATDYFAGTASSPEAWTAQTTTPLTITARRGGTTGNSVALARTGGTPHFSVSGATLTGGSGTDSKASAGWSKAFTGNAMQAAYRQPAGCGFYLQVDDNGPGAGGGMEARTWGFEVMTAYNVGTGQFPTLAQIATSGIVLRKASAVGAIARPWIVLADDRTFYLFVQTGDSTTEYLGYTFGDFYSFNTADPYKCLIIGKVGESGSVLAAHSFPQTMNAQLSNMTGHWLPRNFTGVGGSTVFIKNGDAGLTGGNPSNLIGGMMIPNGSDGGLYLAPVRIIDSSTPGTTIAGSINLRGKMRGLWHAPYPIAAFADGDTFAGSGDLVGRNFMSVRNVLGTIAGSAFVTMETTAWDTSA